MVVSELIGIVLTIETLDDKTKTLFLSLKKLLDSIENKSESSGDRKGKIAEEWRKSGLVPILIPIIYELIPTETRERLIREFFQNLNKAEITNFSNANLEQIISNLKTGKPLFKDIPNNQHNSDIIGNLINNLLGNLSRGQGGEAINNFASNQAELNQTKDKNNKTLFSKLKNFFKSIKDHPLVKPLKYAVMTVNSIITTVKPIIATITSTAEAVVYIGKLVTVEPIVFISDHIAKPILNSKLFKGSNKGEVVGLERGMDGSTRETDGIKRGERGTDKNEKVAGTEDIGTVKIPIETPLVMESLLSAELSTSIKPLINAGDLVKSGGETADDRGHDDRKAEERNTNLFEVGRESSDIARQNEIEEAKEHKDELEVNATNEKLDKKIAEKSDPSITPENDASPGHKTQGGVEASGAKQGVGTNVSGSVVSNEGLNNNAQAPLPEIEISGEIITKSIEAEFTESMVEHPSSLVDNKRPNLKDLKDAVEGAEELIEKKKEEQKDKDPPPPHPFPAMP